MTLRKIQLAACTLSVFASAAVAQTSFPEIEPNTNKVEADAAGTITMVAGDSITGTTTGTTVTALSTLVTSVDQFRIKTGALPLGIYKHQLTITTTGTVGHTGTIRGLNQTGTAGVGGTVGTTDTTIQTSSTATTPARMNVWYGFGKGEELYYRVAGTATTTAPYVATLTTTAQPATIIAPTFEAANPITLSCQGQTTQDTIIHVWDSNFNAIPGFWNDDPFPAAGAQSKLTRTFAPGTYYMDVGSFNTAWNLVAPNDENFPTDALMDFPNVLCRSSSSTALQDFDFQIIASNGTHTQVNQLAAARPYEVNFYQFTVQNGAPLIVPPPPANDNCAAAINVSALGTFLGTTAGATNDGAASCDPGGITSKDVWYSYTNSAATLKVLRANTCGTTLIDTTLTVYSGTCGALTELACNDDCGGAPCAATSSCLSQNVNPGQTVLIRVSDKGLASAAQGPFTLAISADDPPPSNDDCTAPIILAGPGTYPVTNVGATAGAQGQAEAACLFFGFTTLPRDVWYTYTPSTNGLVEVSTCGLIPVPPSASSDSKIAIYAGAGCPAAGTAIACNDDAGTGTGSPATCAAAALNSTIQFTATCGVTYTIQIGMYGGTTSTITGQFSVTETGGTTCATPFTAYCFGDGTGNACPCANSGAVGNGCANSLNVNGANLTASGIASISADTWTLSASGMPNGPGLYYQGVNQVGGGLGGAFGDGLRCVAGSVFRLGIVIAAGNASTYPSPNPPAANQIPISIKGFNVAGGVRNYQLWYRDSDPTFCSASTFNLTNALNMTWAP